MGHVAEANKRSKQLLKEHFQELEGGREDNSSGADDEEDDEEVSIPGQQLLPPHACSRCGWPSSYSFLQPLELL